jgi:RimJ/RimL family protein N-acetyltransferase
VLARYQLTWSTPIGTLLAIEPDDAELATHAAVLTCAYNDPHNARLLGHTELLSRDDVVSHYGDVARAGGHNFLVLRDGVLVADADLRHVANGAAEFAFMVAEVAAQGQGLGTKIALMIHAYAFAILGLRRVYASVIPSNAASRRVFEKLGYVLDTSALARTWADEPDDMVLRIDRAVFQRTHAAQLAEIQIAVR